VISELLADHEIKLGFERFINNTTICRNSLNTDGELGKIQDGDEIEMKLEGFAKCDEWVKNKGERRQQKEELVVVGKF